MKKIFLTFSVIAIAMITRVNAQGTVVLNGAQLEVAIRGGDNIWNGPVILNNASLNEGQNTMIIKQGQGTLQFTKSGDRFSTVSYKDAAGKMRKLSPAQHPIPGLPTISCKDPLPGACFVTADKSIGLCICKPAETTAAKRSGSVYTITFGGSF